MPSNPSRLSPLAASPPLPDRYLITPDPLTPGTSRDAFLAALSRSLSDGIALIQLRSKSDDAAAYRAIAEAAWQRCRDHGARLILNGPLSGPDQPGDGIHLTGARLHAGGERPVPTSALLSAACHTLDDLLQAKAVGVDLVTLSPVLATATHPEANPLGWEAFARLVSATTIPVFALGGMTVKHIDMAKQHGAHGIAAIRGLWG